MNASGSSKKPKKKRSDNAYMRFSSMAFQMIVAIGGGAWGGTALDNHFKNEKPIWTIILSLTGIATSLYLIIRSANKMSNDE